MKAARVQNLEVLNRVLQTGRRVRIELVKTEVKTRSRKLKTRWDPDLEAKPLFIPLKTEWFEKFERGEKDTEYRAYGPRWNEKTCQYGRPATLSHGYNGRRLAKYVVGFKKLSRGRAPAVARRIFPKATHIAAILLSTKKPAMIFTLRDPKTRR